MLTEKKSVFFFSFLLLCALGVNAQTSVKQTTDVPKPSTTEVRENVWQVEREAVSPAEKEAEQQTLQEQPMRQKMANPIRNEAQQTLEQKAIIAAENAIKAKKEAEAVEDQKARLAEVDKPATDEWRTKLAEQNAKYENAAIAKEVPESQSRPVAKKEDWKQLITTTQTELQQTTDPAMRQKLQNKIAILQKKEKAISNETSK